MSAKTLAYATDCALLAIDTFAVVAHQTPADCRRIDVIGDAQNPDSPTRSASPAPTGGPSTHTSAGDGADPMRKPTT